MSHAAASTQGPRRSVLVLGVIAALLNGAATYVGLFFVFLVLVGSPTEFVTNPAPLLVYLILVVPPLVGLWAFRNASRPKSDIVWYGLALNVAALLMAPAAAIGGGLFSWVDRQFHPRGPLTTGAPVFFATYSPAVAVLVFAPLLTWALLWRRNLRRIPVLARWEPNMTQEQLDPSAVKSETVDRRLSARERVAIILGNVSIVLAIYSIAAVWSGGFFASPVVVAAGLVTQIMVSRLPRPRLRGVKAASVCGWLAIASMIAFWVLIPMLLKA